ncbi:tyrosine-protein phosphatase [Eubacterium oxidoreducens]|uniref:protein-tyrosine-phosphatase n=1 Tax=Eubacterium oxidoreducens TaxID=1732 RepID=A0A1G6BLA0_EUBOX|nr:CpsB/CapC family capsule biosynthesis tyrosine phosphatase [Eubacterium oxidoreducens]SDB21393.1 protein-tyrosine phosphatase [Eubacterium oxidoreducens]
MWVDIHTHVLPGIDDGSQNWDETMELAELALSGGTDILVCTNHTNIPGIYENYESENLRTLFEMFQRKLEKEKMPLRILRGNEIFSTPGIQRLLNEKKVIPINNTGYYLVEFSFREDPDFMADVLFGMIKDGYHPILAHPERYECVQDYPAFVFQWMSEGVLTQMNKQSLLGQFGREVEVAAQCLFEHNLITCIASDAHSQERRTTNLSSIAEYLEDRFGEEAAQLLLNENPRRIIEGKRVVGQNLIPFADKGWY